MTIHRPFFALAAVLVIGGAVLALRLASAQTSQPADSAAGQPYGFRTIADIPLTGGTSRFDYEGFDPQARRLYIAHLGAGLVTVFDAEGGTVVGDVGGVKGIHGVIAAPDLGRVFATATGANQLAVIDPQSLSVIATVPGGDYPDGLAYDPDVGKVYISDEHGGTDTVVDAQTNQPVATVQLGGGAGNTQFDPASHQIFVAVHKVNQLVAIDPTTDRVAGRYDMPGCDDPHGLSINPDRRTAFVACEGNAKLLVVDMQTMQVTAE
jgi:YVTN family beta-propeller protein